MKKKIAALCCGLMLSIFFVGCQGNATIEGASYKEAEEKEDTLASDELSDQERADIVAELIDAIYVQERNEDTDKACQMAKDAWDELTDEQKALVYGENADPDYFGLDTGDAKLDDPLNQDDIGESEILVVSFGTSFNDSRVEDIGGIEKAIADVYPSISVRRAFTAQIIINHIQARDGEKIDNVEQALQRAVDNNVKNLIIQPTHLMHGAEYDELTDTLASYADKFENVAVAEPLLGPLSDDANEINDDKKEVSLAITDAAVKAAGYESLDEAKEDGTAFVFMGHGTSHTAKVAYTQMAVQMKDNGYDNVFIGTVEGEPEETECANVINAVKEAGFSKVILRPLMVVAGDHANNDMAGDDEDSWKSMFAADGSFDGVDVQIEGLGRIPAICQLYVNHTKEAISSLKKMYMVVVDDAAPLEDGSYSAEFDTDSGMFHVNEALDGKGTLTVKDGQMTIHVSLAGDGILNLYPGLAEDAQKEGAQLLEPTKDTVEYSDGTKEEVNGFDIPVPYLNEEFDVALVGKKGKWYDHKVKVLSPVKE